MPFSFVNSSEKKYFFFLFFKQYIWCEPTNQENPNQLSSENLQKIITENDENNGKGHQLDDDISYLIQLHKKYNLPFEYHQKLVKDTPHDKVVHHPSNIVVNRPPTEILIHHPPLIVKPGDVRFHNPGHTIHRTIVHKTLPRKYQIRPVYINIVKPVHKNVLVRKPGPKETAQAPSAQFDKTNTNAATQVQQPKQKTKPTVSTLPKSPQPVQYVIDSSKPEFYRNFLKNFNQ